MKKASPKKDLKTKLKMNLANRRNANSINESFITLHELSNRHVCRLENAIFGTSDTRGGSWVGRFRLGIGGPVLRRAERRLPGNLERLREGRQGHADVRSRDLRRTPLQRRTQ